MAIVDLPGNQHWQAPPAPPRHYGTPPGNAHYSGVYPERPHRHPWEIGLLVVVIVFSALMYLVTISVVLAGSHSVLWLSILFFPLVLAFGRGLLFGKQRVNGVKMSPTQFPDGYRLLLQAGHRVWPEGRPHPSVGL